MAAFTQQHRAFRVDTPLEQDILLLQRFKGVEEISRPFEFTLDLLSEDDQVDPTELLRGEMQITLVLPDGERKIHGLVRRFQQLGQKNELTHYRAEIVPWVWFLGLARDCRIFQNKSVLDIAREVFDGAGFSDYEFRCTQTYTPREYCVQYRESHLNFVSRLLEEEGIFYFFEHSDGKHVLVVADHNSAMEPCPGQEKARMATEAAPFQEEDIVQQIQVESSVGIGAVTLRDYDFTRPSLDLEASASDEKGEEVYDYPGWYMDLGDGDHYTQVLLEEGQRDGQVVRGEGTCRAFRSGFKFELEEHYRSDANQEYALLRVEHQGEVGDYRSWDTAPLEYKNSFHAIPFSTPYRPPRRARQPRIHGTQTAVVVGKSGEEIDTDRYGRVKIQFYWDRLGEMDENSSCWVRVSHPWAGKAWGGIHIPRIGQEVIVEFLEGNPDRPIITGRVYNAEQTVPYNLPDNKTQSGIKSRSSKGGGTANFNEIRMEDKKGSEQLYIHAEKDKQVVVENDRSESVGHDESITIGNDRTEQVGRNETIAIGNDRKETVANSETITIGNSRTRNVVMNEAVTIGVAQEVTVGGKRQISVGVDQSLDVGHDHSVEVGNEQSVKVGAKRATEVGEDDELKVAKKVLVDAGDEITIKTGSASITMKKNGEIVIKGMKIEVSGSQEIKLDGTKISSQAKTTNELKGAMVTTQASGIHTIKGSLVKIN